MNSETKSIKDNPIPKNERYADIIKKGRTTQLILGKNYIFIGEIRYFLYNFFGSLFGTILLITLLAIDKLSFAFILIATLIISNILMTWTSFRDPGIIPKNKKSNKRLTKIP